MSALFDIMDEIGRVRLLVRSLRLAGAAVLHGEADDRADGDAIVAMADRAYDQLGHIADRLQKRHLKKQKRRQKMEG